MLRRLRTPWIAALLLLASPSLGGQLLPLLHPCEAQSAGHVHGSAVDHGAHDAPGDHGDPDTGTSCTCIGSCHVPAVPAVPTSIVVALPSDGAEPPAPAVSPATEVVLASRPLDRLPPTTAPPLA